MKGTRSEPPSKTPDRVREPVQVYLDPPDQERLERLTRGLGLSKSEVLRRGLEALEALDRTPSPEPDVPPLPTFGGRGLQPGVDLDDTSALLDRMEGRDAPP
jgi:hypothetical protein